jgi:hypothetical protein
MVPQFHHAGQCGVLLPIGLKKMLIKANLLAVLQIFLALEALATASIVDLGYAQYQGSVDTTTNTTSFLGMRYAAAPLGASSFV